MIGAFGVYSSSSQKLFFLFDVSVLNFEFGSVYITVVWGRVKNIGKTLQGRRNTLFWAWAWQQTPAQRQRSHLSRRLEHILKNYSTSDFFYLFFPRFSRNFSFYVLTLFFHSTFSPVFYIFAPYYLQLSPCFSLSHFTFFFSIFSKFSLHSLPLLSHSNFSFHFLFHLFLHVLSLYCHSISL